MIAAFRVVVDVIASLSATVLVVLCVVAAVLIELASLLRANQPHRPLLPPGHLR